MFALWNIIKKEVKELLTVSTLASIIVIVIIFASMGSLVDTSIKKAKKRPVIAIVFEQNGEYTDLFINTCMLFSKTIYKGKNKQEAYNLIKNNPKGVALIEIPKTFDSNLNKGIQAKINITWFMHGAGTMDVISSSVLSKVMTESYKIISHKILKNSQIPINSKTVLKPVKPIQTTIYKTKTIKGVSPEKIAKILVSQSTMIPIVVMIIIMLGGSMVITSMGMEKENKTLETLLTMPVKREYIVLGKILGGAIAGFVMATIFIIGFKYYMSSFSVPQSSLKALGFDLSVFDYILVGFSLFASLLCGLALSMLLGVLAKDYKSAQLLTYPILTLSLIPMFVNMFKDFDTIPTLLQVFVFIIPFSHPMMAVNRLSIGDYTFVTIGIVYSFILSFFITWLVVKVFKSEKLITGLFS